MSPKEWKSQSRQSSSETARNEGEAEADGWLRSRPASCSSPVTTSLSYGEWVEMKSPSRAWLQLSSSSSSTTPVRHVLQSDHAVAHPGALPSTAWPSPPCPPPAPGPAPWTRPRHRLLTCYFPLSGGSSRLLLLLLVTVFRCCPNKGVHYSTWVD